jgi:creatinine amidohydrolase
MIKRKSVAVTAVKNIAYGPQANFSIFEDTMVEMTWQEVQAGVDRNAVILLPVGIVEGHGPHLDLSADFYISTLGCRFLKQALQEKGIETLIAPPLYWGISQHVAKYAGTFSLRPETMEALLTDIFASLKSWGFRRVFIYNAHGDQCHVGTIKRVIALAGDAPVFRAYFLEDMDIAVDHTVVFPPTRTGRYKPDYHAGSLETAQMAAFFPEKVRGAVAKTLKPQNAFDPLAYCGDPASYDLEFNIEEFAAADAALDALKIEAILKRDGK